MPRRPWRTDPWWIILKRLRAARLVRSVLYGTFPEDAPCWGDKHSTWRSYYCREMLWAFTLGAFAKRRAFRYSEMLNEARALLSETGYPQVLNLGADLDILKNLEQRLKDRATRESRWDMVDLTPQEQMELDAEATWKTYVLSNICPLCGTSLPCESCHIPKMVIDGRGGLRPE